MTNIVVILAAILGVASASTPDFFHGATRTIIEGPSGKIVQETPGSHIFKSHLVSKVYAPEYSGAIAVPEPVIAEHAAVIPAPIISEPLIHRVVPEPVVSAPVLPLAAPVVPEPYLHHSLAYSYGLAAPAPLPSLPVRFSHFVDSRVAHVPTFFEPTVRFPSPVIASRFFQEPSPIYTERFVHPAPVVPAPVRVAPIGVYPAKRFPEVVVGKYSPSVRVPVPATEYGL